MNFFRNTNRRVNFPESQPQASKLYRFGGVGGGGSLGAISSNKVIYELIKYTVIRGGSF